MIYKKCKKSMLCHKEFIEPCNLHQFNFVIIFYKIAILVITYRITVFHDKSVAKVVRNVPVLREKISRLEKNTYLYKVD